MIFQKEKTLIVTIIWKNPVNIPSYRRLEFLRLKGNWTSDVESFFDYPIIGDILMDNNTNSIK